MIILIKIMVDCGGSSKKCGDINIKKYLSYKLLDWFFIMDVVY